MVRLCMKNETKRWLEYAEENLKSARILKDSHLFNSCLQNTQQCVESSFIRIFG
jgi:HEPN domain-containing protein